MKTFKQYVGEAWTDQISGSRSDPTPTDIFINPTRKELASCANYGGCPAILLDDDMYVWKDSLHYEVIDKLQLDKKNIIPLRLYLDRSTVLGVEVTDTSKRTNWNHNPEVYDAIINHRFIRLYGEDIEGDDFVSYYDEAIGGSWHK
jgi:hypothetical protein